MRSALFCLALSISELFLILFGDGEKNGIVHGNGGSEVRWRGRCGDADGLRGAGDGRACRLTSGKRVAVARHEREARRLGCACGSDAEAGVVHENLADATVGCASGFLRIFRRCYGKERDEASGRADGGEEIVVAGDGAGIVGGDERGLRRALRGGAGASVAQINLAARRRVGDEVGGGRTERDEAAVGGYRRCVAVVVGGRSVAGSRKQRSVRLAIGSGAGASVAQENLRVAILRGGVGDETAVCSECGSFFRDRERGRFGGVGIRACGVTGLNEGRVRGNGESGSAGAGAAAADVRIADAAGSRGGDGGWIKNGN